MEYFRINYSKLQNLSQIKFFKIILCIICLLITLIILANKIYIQNKFTSYGIYNNGLFLININVKLSDDLKKNDYIYLNDELVKFKINGFGENKIVNNEVYQDIELIIDKEFYDNEVLLIEFYYNKTSILKYVLDLFK